VQAYQEWSTSYPRDYEAYGQLGLAYTAEGQYEKAADIYREAVRLAPDRVIGYGNLASSLIGLQRFEEVRQTAVQEQAHKLDDLASRDALYAVAFLRGDVGSMVDEQKWFAGRPEENQGLSLDSDTEAYSGHLAEARELTRRSLDSAIRADSKKTGAIWLENSACAKPPSAT
jgi:eukaryotic-like serine/threonine-protein kinase